MNAIRVRRPLPIEELACELGLEPDEVEPYGRTKAKISLVAHERRAHTAPGRLVAVTSITPTPAGEGKTTSAIGLVDALARIGEQPLAALREPSLGPVFGIKGGGTGGGLSQLTPADEINLHFTGDIHAIGAANNLLAAVVEASLLHGNPLRLDPHTITWRRCLDMDDRALRKVVVGLGGRTNGSPRETGFDITAASEVMAILAVASDVADLRRRLGAIVVGLDADGAPVTAEALGVAGSMAALLAHALHPNLVQTLEGTPAIVHCGPFANIAHGNSSLVGTRLGLHLADWVVTESGFGADMGFEKLIDIVLRGSGVAPSVVVVVATVKALKHHGGDVNGGLAELERGADNLAAHLAIVRRFGLEAVVAVNRFPTDDLGELHSLRAIALERGAFAAEIAAPFESGGAGCTDLAEAVVEAALHPSDPAPLYGLEEPLPAKIEAIARAYGAAGVSFKRDAQTALAQLEGTEAARLPVCMAKTHLSLSHDPKVLGAPTGFTLPIRDVRPYAGAGWVLALCGDMQTMPGLPARPAALRIDVDAEGAVVGLR